MSRYLKAYYKIAEFQKEVSEEVAESRVKHAELEKELGTNLANLESKYRQTVGSSRSEIAGIQDDLTISLSGIANRYMENKAKKQERITTEKTKEETPYAQQTSSLVARFREAREARYNGASGITRRIG